MVYYGIKIFNLVKFDYHGGDSFSIEIFKDSGTECNYPTVDPIGFLKAEMGNVWKKSEYVFNSITLHVQKSFALWSFNAIRNVLDYYELKIFNFHTDPRLVFMVSNFFLFKQY